MIAKILPFILLLVGVAAGAGAGIYLRPDVEVLDAEGSADPAAAKASEETKEKQDVEYVKMNNQFVVPLVDEASLKGVVLLSLSLEVPAGPKDAIYAKEPKLRDSFLQVLFDHANIGGFDGEFTDGLNLANLRGLLRGAAQKVLGEQITDVLIVEIARQDY